jgi:hypothetical protein
MTKNIDPQMTQTKRDEKQVLSAFICAICG